MAQEVDESGKPATAAEPPQPSPQATISINYAAGGYNIAPKKRAYAAKAFVTTSLIFGAIMFAVSLIGYLAVFQDSRTMQILQKLGVYDYFMAGSIAGIGLLALMMFGASGLSTLKPWARQALIAYAILIVVLEIGGMIISSRFIDDLNAMRNRNGQGGQDVSMSPLALFGCVLYIGHGLWTMVTVASPQVKRAYAAKVLKA